MECLYPRDTLTVSSGVSEVPRCVSSILVLSQRSGSCSPPEPTHLTLRRAGTLFLLAAGHKRLWGLQTTILLCTHCSEDTPLRAPVPQTL